MPKKLNAILLVPAKDDPHGLLAMGGAGAQPPGAHLHRTSSISHEACFDCDALILIHRDGHQHCTVCDEWWPCEDAGKEVRSSSEEWVIYETKWSTHDFTSKPNALVLSLGNKPIPEGIDRLIRIWSGLTPFQVAGGWKKAAPLVYELLYNVPRGWSKDTSLYQKHLCCMLLQWGMLSRDTEDRICTSRPPSGDLTVPWFFALTSECLGLGSMVELKDA